MILLISYDLNRPGQNYSALHEEIKQAGTWWHHLESTWLIETNQTPNQWYDRLAKHLDATDNILIIEVTRNYYGWLPQKAWDWLSARSF
jgi:hypothetical protein